MKIPMFKYDLIVNAIIAGVLIATVCGIMSFFTVLRRSAFATHSLSHMSLTGAAMGGVFGFSPLIGQMIINICSAIIIGTVSEKIKKNDLTVGVILVFVMGLGSYFLFLYQNNYAGGVMNILFGDILSVSNDQLKLLLLMSIFIIIVLLIIFRSLIFVTIDPVIAEAKRVPTKLLSTIYLILLALTITMACQIVGVLLVFSMLIIPGAIAVQWFKSTKSIIISSIIIANFSVLLSLIISFYYNVQFSFCITTLLSTLYTLKFIYLYSYKKFIAY